ncbi:MAG: riboflavin synthase [Actinobacteria bacterium]|jgi:riboflavin synthase|nr:MAG: riboflavin synthase [Actinomycetota bacterium]
MFTGIIEEVGSLRDLRSHGNGASITVSCRHIWKGLDIGDSVAVNGVCLTVVGKGEGSFAADISGESMQRSSLGGLKRGMQVNLERALTLNSRLGGHIVQGHVDGVGVVVAVKESPEGSEYTFTAPAQIAGYLVEKGSIAVDGISLTISALGEDEFSVAVIPHTARETNLKGIKAGDPVNLEVDILAKYVRRYLERGFPGDETAGEGGGSFYEKLVEGGFA